MSGIRIFIVFLFILLGCVSNKIASSLKALKTKAFFSILTRYAKSDKLKVWNFLSAIISILIALFSFLGVRTQSRLSKLEAGQARFDSELKEIKNKLDQLLAKA